jgi:hypothetical protein
MVIASPSLTKDRSAPTIKRDTQAEANDIPFPTTISPIPEPFHEIDTSFQTREIVSFSLCRYPYNYSSSRLILCKASGGTKKLFGYVEGDS